MIETRPNILLLTIDCWRGDHLGASGDSPSPTPHLDQLAAEGTVFEQAITCGGWTRPAMMAMFSSVYASYHHGGPLRQISPDLPVLAELLQSRGYETGGFTANLICGAKSGFDRGFDTFADLRTDDRQSLIWNKLKKVRGYRRFLVPLMCHPLPHQLVRLFGLRLRLPEILASAQQLTSVALDWLKQPHAGPVFLWAHYVDLHWPYRLSRRPDRPRDLAQAWRDRQTYRQIVKSRGRFDPGAETRARWQALYREELITVDEQIGRLIAHLRDSGQLEHTTIIVTSDHGEEFFERGTWAHSWNQLFDEGTRVPLITRVPSTPGKNRVCQQVSTLDVAPTLLDAAGIKAPDTMLGASLLPSIKDTSGKAPAGRNTIAEMLGHRNSYRYRLALRTETHRYIHDIEHPHDNQLYDLLVDSGECDNIYDKASPISRQFDRLRFDHMAPIVPDLLEIEDDDDVFADTDPEVVERLRAMGYLS